MTLKEIFDSGKFAVTSEVGPPKGVDISEMMEGAEYFRDRVDAINVTDLQSSAMRLGSLAVCHLLKEKGFEPIFQMACRDRNRLALQSDLLSAYTLGIRNVLCLTGDHTTLGDHPDAMPVYDLDSVSLLETITTLMKGYDLAGNKLEGAPEFCVGAVVSPGADPLEPQIIKMEMKIEAGATFFQTQGVFEVDKFEKFMKATEHLKVPIMAGIILLKSAGMARFMNSNVAGVFVPNNLIKEMNKAKSKARVSVKIAGRLIKELKGMCSGVHIMPLGWDKWVPAVLDEAGL
ncbi:MAG: methylenetetrahydrofolate reductase [Candidatus Poribacteria bacterium]